MAQVPESPWESQSDLPALPTTKNEPGHFETAQALGPDVPATLLARADQGDQLEMAVSRGATAEMARTRPTFQRARFLLIETKMLRITSGPIPKFAGARVTFRCELRNLRT